MTDYLIGNQEEMYQWAYRLTRNYDDAQDSCNRHCYVL